MCVSLCLCHFASFCISCPLDVTTLGDFAYDLGDDGGLNGDAFMTRIVPLASRLPYMTTVGNHEIEADMFQNYRCAIALGRLCAFSIYLIVCFLLLFFCMTPEEFNIFGWFSSLTPQ